MPRPISLLARDLFAAMKQTVESGEPLEAGFLKRAERILCADRERFEMIVVQRLERRDAVARDRDPSGHIALTPR